MSHYYEEHDLERFNEIGKHCPELFDYFMNYYQGVMAAGALTAGCAVLRPIDGRPVRRGSSSSRMMIIASSRCRMLATRSVRLDISL